MNELTGLVRDSGPLEPPYALPVSVPVPDDHAVYPKRALRNGQRSEAGTGVLVVDDDPVVHRALTRFLTSRGYRILAARTPGEALFIAKHEQIAVVITDLIMPEMTGYDLVARIEKLQPAVQVIYMSGYAASSVGGVTGAGNMGNVGSVISGGGAKRTAAPLLQKPFDVEDLVRVLSAALKQTVQTVTYTDTDTDRDALPESKSKSTRLASNDP
jgi:CheY-like chemotaxis protein